MKCPDAKQLRPLVKNGQEKHRKKVLKDTISLIKRSASHGDTDREFLMSSDEDVQYCAEFLQQKGYKTIATHGVLGCPLLYVKWGEENERRV